MKEIKFKVFVKSKNKIFDVYGFNKDKVFIETNDSPEHGVNIFDRDDCVLFQFTGLQDVNGEDIYESDIVEFTFFTYLETEYEETKKGQIIFDNFGFCFKVNEEEIYLLGELEFDSQAQIEIIGNIYENPELI